SESYFMKTRCRMLATFNGIRRHRDRHAPRALISLSMLVLAQGCATATDPKPSGGTGGNTSALNGHHVSCQPNVGHVDCVCFADKPAAVDSFEGDVCAAADPDQALCVSHCGTCFASHLSCALSPNQGVCECWFGTEVESRLAQGW